MQLKESAVRNGSILVESSMLITLTALVEDILKGDIKMPPVKVEEPSSKINVTVNETDRIPPESFYQLQEDYRVMLLQNKELSDTCARLAATNSILKDQLKEIGEVLSRKVVELIDKKDATPKPLLKG
jgi:hypothetical protein